MLLLTLKIFHLGIYNKWFKLYLHHLVAAIKIVIKLSYNGKSNLPSVDH
jgi:hypothetical protein